MNEALQKYFFNSPQQPIGDIGSNAPFQSPMGFCVL